MSSSPALEPPHMTAGSNTRPSAPGQSQVLSRPVEKADGGLSTSSAEKRVKAGSQVIDTLVSKLPNAIELYLGSVPLDDPVRFLSRSP